MQHAEALRVLVCVDGARIDRLVSQVSVLVTPTSRWVPLHVIDSRPRVNLGILRAGMPGGGSLPEAQRRAIENAGGEHAQLVVHAALAAFTARGLAADNPLIRTGEPGSGNLRCRC